ncbi:hypothetical protein [Methylovulum psychrotolerans]|uniref:Uncharacterized protein n=1 Tax=Methylovulum psychrotolerans TaxID=1704499 RepID=A0A1Z4C0F2_9GAMM|nr:hypothetical protein [Methylovulum psychrotolerans]ASF47018.1 hypothetical protein CEK71_13575 [Methylovulum psychrotolerans]
MNKVQFVQEMIIRTCPGQDKFAPAIAHAEWLWAELTKAGYGDPKPDQPKARKSQDWYEALNDRQKRFFNAFWQAFALKTGRNEAARNWQQLGDLSDEQYQKIIEAAGKEARRELVPGQSRKYAQGWLFEQRWKDHQGPPQAAKNAIDTVIGKLSADLVHIKKLYQQSQDEALLPQITKIENAIREARDSKVNNGKPSV